MEQAGRGIDYWSGPGTWAEISENWKPELLRTIAKVPLDFQAIAGSSDRLDDYTALGLPIRLTAGTTGPSPARVMAKLLAGALGGDSLTVVEGVGHMAPVTDAPLVNPLIAEHLSAHSAGV